jgi:hypothetical protein
MKFKSIKYKISFFQWTAAPLVDNLPIDTYHYLITVHTGFGKHSGTTSNISFVISGELSDSGVRKLSNGKIQVSFTLLFPTDSLSNACTFVVNLLFSFNRRLFNFLHKYSVKSNRLNALKPNHLNDRK